MAWVEGVRRIAVVRPNGIGDFLFATPALSALRDAYPDAEIVYLGRPWHRDFLAGRPGPVDRVVEVPAGLVDGEARDREFFASMRAEQFDLALQLYGGGRHSNPFTRRLGARVTAGLRTPDAEPLDRCVPYVYFQHEVLRLLEVVGLVGAQTVHLEPRLEVTDADRDEAERAFPPARGPVAVLNPGATDGRRRWPPEKFGRLADSLARRGVTVAVTGSEDDRPLAADVVASASADVVDLAGVLSLSGLAGLYERAQLVVSNDSGPLHLAAAVGTATVGIFWCGNLINAGPFERTHHRPVLSWRLHCPVCGIDVMVDQCRHDVSFVADVEVPEVEAHALDLLPRSQSLPVTKAGVRPAQVAERRGA